MENSQVMPANPQSGLASLPRAAFGEIMLVLCRALPPAVSDRPADRRRRDRAALAGVAALLPVNAAEGRLAAQFVVADAWAMDRMRVAEQRQREPEVARKCLAQAISLTREGKSSLRLLLKLQAARHQADADEAAGERNAWVEHAAASMMQEALDLDVAPPAAPEAQASPVAPVAGPIFATVSCDTKESPDVGFETPVRPVPATSSARD